MQNPFLTLSVKDQVLFAKRLSFLVHSGVPILDSLKMLRDQTKGKGKRKILDQIIANVANGQFLSSSMAKFNNIFGDFAVNIIRVGETSGTLDENLNYLAEELKKKQLLRRKVIGSLIYPILIIISTLGITGLLTVYIFPKILPIFESLHVKLPITTRILIFISRLLTAYGLYLIAGIILLGIGAVWLRSKKKSFHLMIDRMVLKIPFLGSIALHYQTANFCRTLGLLLKSDIRVVEAISITADTTSNLVYHNRLQIVAQHVLKGEKVSQNLEKYPEAFPPIVSHMVAIGETTGTLSETLGYLAELYESELDELTKNLSSAIEPILMMLMGLVVGLVAVSIITPIYEITQNLHP